MVQMEQMRQRLISNWTTTTNETRILSNLIYLGWFFFRSRSALMKLINILNKYFPYSSNFTAYLWKSVAYQWRAIFGELISKQREMWLCFVQRLMITVINQMRDNPKWNAKKRKEFICAPGTDSQPYSM